MINLKHTRRALLAGLVCATIILPMSVAEAKEQAPKMWVITDADSTIYLYGSFHLLKADTKWKTPGFDKVFNSADTLYLEIDNLDDEQTYIAMVQKYGIDPTGSLLKPYTPEELTLIRATYKKYGLDVDKLTHLKPWMASVVLVIEQMKASGFNPAAGVDKTILAAARAKNLPVKGMETMEDQMKVLSTGLLSEEAKALLDVAKDDPKAKAMFERLLTAWSTGDVKTVERLMIDEMKTKTPKMYEAVMVTRNRNWVQPIKDVLAGSGTQMIVVGAGHLAGPDSVQALLKKEGIKVEPYDYQSAK